MAWACILLDLAYGACYVLSQVDPFLELDENSLRTTKLDVSHYGTSANNASAAELLASIRMQDISNETLVSLILSNLSAFEVYIFSLLGKLLTDLVLGERLTELVY